MTFVGMPYPSGNLQTALDAVTIHPHGMFNTHIDAFAHVGYKDYTFNGRRVHPGGCALIASAT